jgi:hypothetical protein
MSRLLPISILAVAALVGCQHHESRVTVLDADECNGRPANLVLGRTAEEAWLTEQFATRVEWPIVERGYRFDDVTWFNIVNYDYQQQFDCFGGLYSANTSVQTGVHVP